MSRFIRASAVALILAPVGCGDLPTQPTPTPTPMDRTTPRPRPDWAPDRTAA